MTEPEQERLIEEVVSAHRERDPRGGLKPSPAFYDLDEEDRTRAFERALAQRALEAALDPEGQSSAVKRVLRLVRRGS